VIPQPALAGHVRPQKLPPDSPLTKLGPEARSLWGPALLTVVLLLAALVTTGALVVDLATNVDTDELRSVDADETDLDPADGASPDDGDGVVVEPGEGRDPGVTIDDPFASGDRPSAADERRERGTDALVEAYESTSARLALLAVALIAAALVMQARWLAVAYRCLPGRQQIRRPGQAYRPVRVAVGYLLAWTALAALAEGPFEDDPGIVVLLAALINLVTLVCMVFALLRVIDMIGDVTFAYAHRHYGTARAMALSLKGELLLYGLLVVLAFAAVSVEPGSTAALVLDIAGMTTLGLLAVLPVVFVVSYVIAVLIATAAVEATLSRAADQLAQLERAGELHVRRPRRRR
jgi:hypothetical protein